MLGPSPPGIAHLLWVSGLNVGMVAPLAYALAWAALALVSGAGEPAVIQRAAALASLPAEGLPAAVCGGVRRCVARR